MREKKKQSDERPTTEDLEQTAGISRRKFLSRSVAGAGALALPGVSCAVPAGADREVCDPADEVWVQPWEWRVWEHGVDPLPLVVTEASSFDIYRDQEGKLQVGSTLFTYGGIIPGPTIRTRGDASIRVQLLNTLSGNDGTYAADKGSRFVKKSSVPGCGDFEPNTPVPCVPDWQLADSLLYGPHSQHTTNLHTHGLHVSPLKNPVSGYHGDNVLLRLIPHQDKWNRESHIPQIPLKEREYVGDLQYQFSIGKASGPNVETHPPGTHWYHPHPHGATWDQVSTGMAGFLIVEGDVEETINETLRVTDPDPSTKSGPNCYRERPILIQRIKAGPVTEAEGGPGSQARTALVSVNGEPPGVLGFHMRPGAIERWRLLNGSVDGQGYVNFAVVKGRAVPYPGPAPTEPKNPTEKEKEEYERELAAYNEKLKPYNDFVAYIADPDNRADLHLMAFDGVGLVGNDGRYYVQDLADGFDNTMMVGPANRADFLFQAPREPGVYTIVGQYVAAAVDKLGPPPDPTPPIDVATIVVDGDRVPGTKTIGSIDTALRGLEAPGLIQPVADRELIVGNFEYENANATGDWRCRRIVYGGWGAASSKAMTGNPYADKAKYPNQNFPGCEKEIAAGKEPCEVQDFGEPNTMSIDGRKFDSALAFHTMAVGSAEEWTLENQSLTIIQVNETKEFLYGKTADDIWMKQTSEKDYTIITSSVDHPFHIHQNPFWVTRIQGPDGTDLDWNYQPLPRGQRCKPRWQDVVRIPRNGGRITFRARFWDYTGEYVNHCHLLQHEDMGMMQTVAVVPDPFDADYEARPAGYEYPWPTLRDMYFACLVVVSPVQPQQKSLVQMFCDGAPETIKEIDDPTHLGDEIDEQDLPCQPTAPPPPK